MAFSLGNRSGWNRLWLVVTALWLCNVLWSSLTNIPSRDDIERSYQYELSRLTPQSSDLHRQVVEDGYKYSLEGYPQKVMFYWIRNGIAALLPFVLYGLIWLAVKVGSWIIRGFTTPNPS